MSEAILLAIQAVSYVVIVIIMAVMANTMAMTARERYGEYATFKALGFSNVFVAMLIFAESLGIALLGGLLGIAFTFPHGGGVRERRRVDPVRLQGVAGNGRDAVRGGAGHRRRRGGGSRMERGARSHRRRAAGDRMSGRFASDMVCRIAP